MSNRRIIFGLILITIVLVADIIYVFVVQNSENKQGNIYSILAMVCFFIYFLRLAIQKRK